MSRRDDNGTGDLFPEPLKPWQQGPPPLPPHSNETTSRNAAESMHYKVGTDCGRVLGVISRASDGLTCDGVEVITGLLHQNASARIYTLRGLPEKDKLPVLVADSGRQRKTRSGRLAIVWVIA